MRRELVVLLEERSAKVMLETFLPRVLDEKIEFRLIAFEGKQDLEKRMTMRIKGYVNEYARFLVMRDQDSDPNCINLKARLIEKCNASGRGDASLVRVACRELETFYLAYLRAVEMALGLKGLSNKQHVAKFRSPDYLTSPSHELKVLSKQTYEKIGSSREIGRYLDIDNARSDSFRNLVQGIKRLEGELLAL
ncbi:DUF4276 family protein [Pseudomonas poae]|uniref:DUF4276 family protein n=1 Tax=Pseudomonas poae TaxID=200451 RepID=A0ABY0S3F9_9PSED|nr:DUF4276 family protein [Pseudomonas poae]KRP51674.1 hypothetical protein TU75_09585 [Pseudomonas poae]SDO76027.1 protein of unknown function [Pseudomonas poae]